MAARGNPLDYYARNKEAIEKESGFKLNIPSSEEIATVIANDPGAKVRREEEIAKLKQSLGINEKELEALGGAVDNPDQFNVFSTDKYKEGAEDIVTKYKELFEDLQDATDDRDEALIKKIKSQIINSPTHRLLNNQAFGEDIDRLTSERSTLLQLFNTESSSGQLEQALTIKMAITTIDKQLWNKLVDRGILDLQTNSDGEILESAMSEHMGREVRFQRRSDGKFHFFVDGELYQNPTTKKEYWTQSEISSKVSYEVNEEFEAARKAYIASIAEKKVSGMLTETDAATNYNALIIQIAGDNAAMQREQLKDAGATFGPMDTNTGNFIMRAGGSFYLMRSDPKEIGDTGVLEARFEKIDIPTMLGIALSGNDEADAAMRAWFASIGLAGAGLTLQ